MIDRRRFDTITGGWYNRRVVLRNDKLAYERLCNPSANEALIAKTSIEKKFANLISNLYQMEQTEWL